MAGWSEACVDIGDQRLHYLRSGGAKPALVLAHGISDSAACWLPVARLFVDLYDVILPDARGHGLSARLPPEPAIDMGADLAAFVMALDVGPVALGGHSLGAESAAGAAALHPEIARLLILEDPPWRAPEVKQDPSWADWLKDMEGRSLGYVAGAIREVYPGWSEEEVQVLAQAKLELDYRIFDMRRENTAWREVLPQLDCPGLVLVGDPALGGIVTPAVVQHAQQLWPSARFVSIAGAGHGIHRDQPDAFVSAVRSYMEEAIRP
jgi:pimeloyl-ACP methyl ester carboxylesterase